MVPHLSGAHRKPGANDALRAESLAVPGSWQLLQRKMNVGRARHPRQLPHLLGFFGLVRFADLAAGEQLQLLLLSKPDPNHVAGLTDQGQKKPNLVIDRLWRSCLFQLIGLIFEDCGCIDVNEQCVAEETHYMPDCIFGEIDPPETHSLIRQIFIGHVPQLADAILAPFLDIVEALLEFASPLAFGVLGRRLRG
jgi:hypothetical protein